MSFTGSNILNQHIMDHEHALQRDRQRSKMFASPLQADMELHSLGTIVSLFVIISGVGYLLQGRADSRDRGQRGGIGRLLLRRGQFIL